VKRYPFARVALAWLVTVLYSSGALAQVDLTGDWALASDQSKPFQVFPADFAGVPVNTQGREAGAAHSEEENEELYRQCEPWSQSYILNGPFAGRFEAIRDLYGTVEGWRLSPPAYDRLPNTIWIDGRMPPPKNALHTYAGFTTGRWDGTTLVTSTVNLTDSFITSNGVPASDQETLHIFYTRHGNEMSVLGIVRDPAYLDAPWPVARTWELQLTANATLQPHYCQPAEIVSGLSDGYHTAVVLPDQIREQMMYMPRHYGIPLAAALGGEQTMYPEFQKTLLGGYKRPSTYCTEVCTDGRLPPAAEASSKPKPAAAKSKPDH
jgi:hypothetical protein